MKNRVFPPNLTISTKMSTPSASLPKTWQEYLLAKSLKTKNLFRSEMNLQGNRLKIDTKPVSSNEKFFNSKRNSQYKTRMKFQLCMTVTLSTSTT